MNDPRLGASPSHDILDLGETTASVQSLPVPCAGNPVLAKSPEEQTVRDVGCGVSCSDEELCVDWLWDHPCGCKTVIRCRKFWVVNSDE